ncbi:MAG TPA: hypothetical protein PLP88_04630 [Bacteroidales bacterium]|nr:hypothetical protein [Bacteroidales bacterium]
MKKGVILALIALLSIAFHPGLFSQQADFRLLEDSLQRMSERVWQQKDDASMIACSADFSKAFQQVLALPGSFDYPFDSIKGIGKLTSDDKRFRIFTWNIHESSGRFSYFGIVMTGGPNPRIYVLSYSKNKPAIVKNQALTPSDWYGALYYKIIPCKIGKQTVYLLLGWDGIDNHSNSKLIEVLSFSPDGSPLFGMPVFHTAKGVVPRVVIEYAEDASLVLRYDYQTLLVPKGKGVKRKQMWMIVTDHLVPLDARFEGQYEYYVPVGNTYDAFIFRKGKWLFAEGVEANNPPTGNKQEERKPLNYNLFPPK